MPDEKFSIPIKVQEVPSADGYRRYRILTPIKTGVEIAIPKDVSYETYIGYLKSFIRAEVLNVLETPITIKELKESK